MTALSGEIASVLRDDPLWCTCLPSPQGQGATNLLKGKKQAQSAPPSSVATSSNLALNAEDDESNFQVLNPIEGVLMAFLLLGRKTAATSNDDDFWRPSNDRHDVGLLVQFASSLVLPPCLAKAGVWASSLVALSGPQFMLNSNAARPFAVLDKFEWEKVTTAIKFERLCLPFRKQQDEAWGDQLHACHALCGSAAPKQYLRRSLRAHVAVLGGACYAGSADVLSLELDIFKGHTELSVIDFISSGRKKIDPTSAAMTNASCLKVLHEKCPGLLKRAEIPSLLTLTHGAAKEGNLACLRYIFQHELNQPDVIQQMEVENPGLTTALYRVTRQGRLDMYRYLVEEQGFTPKLGELFKAAPEESELKDFISAAITRRIAELEEIVQEKKSVSSADKEKGAGNDEQEDGEEYELALLKYEIKGSKFNFDAYLDSHLEREERTKV